MFESTLSKKTGNLKPKKRTKKISPLAGSTINATRTREREGRPGAPARTYATLGEKDIKNPTANTSGITQGLTNIAGEKFNQPSEPRIISSGPGRSYGPSEWGQMISDASESASRSITPSPGTAFDIRGAVQQAAGTMGGDISLAQAALEQRQANEAGALGLTEQGTAAIQASRGASGDITAARRGQLAQGDMAGRNELAGAKGNITGMTGRFADTAGRIQGRQAGAAGAAQAGTAQQAGQIARRGELGARRVTGSQAARGQGNVQSVMQNVREQTQLAMGEAEAGRQELLKKADAVKNENLNEYRNLSVQAAQVATSALAANREAAKRQIMENIPEGPARAEALAQLNMDFSQKASDEVSKINMQYTETRASLRGMYDQIGADLNKFGTGMVAQARSTFGQLTAGMDEKIRTAMSGQALEAGLTTETNLLNSRVAMAGQSTALRTAALQESGALSRAELDSLSWMEQNGSKFLIELAGMSNRMWEMEQQFGLQNDQYELVNQLAYDQLLSGRYTELADRYSGQNTDYVPLSPYEFQLIQIMSDIEDREQMQAAAGPAFT